jgi:hypothetical protein
MVAAVNVPSVGAMDPELRNSPIAEEFDEDADDVRLQAPVEPVCYFNNKAYANDAFVRSGDSMLRCRYGVWIETGPADPTDQ